MSHNISNTAAALVAAFVTEQGAKADKAAAAALVPAFWQAAAALADESGAAQAAAALKEAAAAVGDIIAAALADNATAYHINGRAFAIGLDKTGGAKPLSKQAAYVRLSDTAGRFAALAALPPLYHANVIRATETELAAIRGERAFVAALAKAKEDNALAALSPIRRRWKEFEAANEAAAAAAAAIETAKAAVTRAESVAAAARAKALEIEADAMAGEAAAAAAVQSNGRYDAGALARAKEEAAAARGEAVAALARAEAAEAAAAAAGESIKAAAAAVVEKAAAAPRKRVNAK